MRTKQPIRAKRDHFMQRDCAESAVLDPVPPVLTTHKQATSLSKAQPRSDALMRPEGKECTTSPSQSPTSVLAPIVTPPPPLTLPAAVVKPRLPSAAVWGIRAPTAATATATAPTKSVSWADVHAAPASDSRAAAALSSSFDTPTPAARGSLARCRKHGPHARAAMQSQVTSAEVEKWIDELKLQAQLCKTSPLVFSVTIPEQRSFGGRAFPLTLVPAAAPHTPAMLKAR